jgi:hypothetical protein
MIFPMESQDGDGANAGWRLPVRVSRSARQTRILAALLFSTVVPYLKAAPHLDVLLYLEGTYLKIGAFDFATSSTLPDYRVFTAQTEIHSGLTGGYTDSPGWNALRNPAPLPPGASLLPPSVDLGFNIIATSQVGRNLVYWDGTGEVAFGAVPAGEVILVSKGQALSGRIVADGGTNNIPGYAIATTSGGGYIHRHLSFSLYGDDTLNDFNSDVPTPGIYLIGLEATLSGFALPSAPLWIVFSHKTEATKAVAAANWVTENLAAPAKLKLEAPHRNSDGHFVFWLDLAIGQSCAIEFSSNLTNWAGVTNIHATSSATEVTLPTNGYPGRTFFRAIMLQTP